MKKNKTYQRNQFIFLPKTAFFFLLFLFILPDVIGQNALQWSTYLGGTNTDVINGMAEDANGNLIIVGQTTSPNFPTTPDAIQPTYLGTSLIRDYAGFVVKLAPDGNTILWSTYLSGLNLKEFAIDVAVDTNNDIYVLLKAQEGLPITTGAYQITAAGGSTDAYIAKLSPTGSLIWSTYVGGVDEDIPIAIATDNNNNVFITGHGKDPDFPTTPTAYQPNLSGNGDAFLVGFDTNGNNLFSTFFGGTENDVPTDLLVNSNGEIYLAGHTTTSTTVSFPTTNGAYDTTPSVCTDCSMYGNRDFFIAKFSNDGTELLASTLLGNEGYEVNPSIVLDSNEDIYLTGTAGARVNSAMTAITIDYPTTAGAILPATETLDIVIPFSVLSKLDKDLTTLLFSSRIDYVSSDELKGQFITSYESAIVRLAIDDCDRIALLSSSGFSEDSGIEPELFIQGPTADAFQKTNTNGYFMPFLKILEFDSGALTVDYATYLGSASRNESFGTLFSQDNDVVVYNTTYQSNVIPNNFPVTQNAFLADGVTTVTGYDWQYNGNRDGTITKFTSFEPVANTLVDYPTGTTFCINGAIDGIDGNDASSLIPSTDIYKNGGANPQITKVIYTWQYSIAGPTGPWVDIIGATTEDYIPTYNATAGSRWYRRLVNATNNINCTIPLNASNVVEVVINTNISHTTNGGGLYDYCPDAPLNIGEAITVSPDGLFAPYTYNWTPTDNLNAPTNGTFTPPMTPSVTTTTQEDAVYILEVEDTRGCKSIGQAIVNVTMADAGEETVYTCGEGAITLGPTGPENPDITTYSWTPTTGLSDPTIRNPILTTLPPTGSSVKFYLTVNDCAASVDSQEVFNNSAISLPALPPVSLCQGDTVILGGGETFSSFLDYVWAPGTNIADNTDPYTMFIGVDAPDTVNIVDYILNGIDPITGCSDTTSQEITWYRMPFTTFDQQYPACGQDSAVFNYTLGASPEAGMSYLWTATVFPLSAGNGIPTDAEALSYLSSTSTPLVNWNPPGPTIPNGGFADVGYDIMYIRQAFNTVGTSCGRQDTAMIFYRPGDCTPGGCDALGTGGTDGWCAGNFTVIGPETAYRNTATYQWSPVDGLYDQATNEPLVAGELHTPYVIANPTSNTTYYLTVSNTSTNYECIIDFPVFAGPNSFPITNYEDTLTCPNVAVEIQQTPIVGYSYEWRDNDDLNLTTIANPTATPASNSTYYVDVMDVQSGCVTKDTVKVVATEPPIVMGEAVPFCATSGLIVELGGPPEVGYTYEWLAPAVGLANSDSSAIKDTIYGNTTYILEVTSVAGCVTRDTVDFVTVASPTADAGPTQESCDGGTVKLGATEPEPAGVSYTYQWTSNSTGNGLTPAEAAKRNLVVTTSGTGPWVYNLIVTQAGATSGDPDCSSNVSSVTINPVTGPTFTGGGTPCAAPGVTIGIATAETGWSYSWNPANDITIGHPGANEITVYPSQNTTYTLTAISPAGCEFSNDFTITAPSYAVDLGDDAILCKGEANPTVGPTTPAPGGATFLWTGNVTLLSATTIENPTFDLANATAGTYTLKLTTSYGGGCESSDEITLTIGEPPTNLAGDNQVICKGDCIVLGQPKVNGLLYQWTTIPYNPVIIAKMSSISEAQPSICLEETITFQLTVKELATNCESIDYVTISAPQSPPDLQVKDTILCQNEKGTQRINLNELILANDGVLDGFFLDGTGFVPVADPTQVGVGTYYIKATSTNGQCTDLDTVTVTINDLPNFTAIGKSASCETLGSIVVSGFSTNDRFAYTIGNTYTGSATYATATKIPSSGIITNTLAFPTGNQPYTVRVFKDTDCYRDATIAITGNCPCKVQLDDLHTDNCVDAGGNTYTANLNVKVTWQGPPTGENLVVSLDGSSSQTIATSDLVGSQNLTFAIPADGSINHQITANFATTTSCGDTLTTKYPTPCSTNLGNETGKICTNVATEIAGTVFEDWNYDGIMNQDDTIGVQGIQVIATDANGSSTTTYTDANGNYQFTGLTSGADYRIEFSLPDAVLCWAKPTNAGGDNGTMVQFVQAGACANLGIASPDAYCQENSEVFAACFVNGNNENANNPIDVLVKFAHEARQRGNHPDYTAPEHLSFKEEIGAIHGLAYNKKVKAIYSAAFFKRHVGLNEDDPVTNAPLNNPLGAIYNTDVATHASKLFIDVSTIAGVNVGSVPNNAARVLPNDPSQPSTDSLAYGLVGKVGLGDIDISGDGKYLYATNLFDKTVLKIEIKADGTAGTVATIPIPDPNCNNGTYRPFGLEIYKGMLYIGVVCDASISGSFTDLTATVYQYNGTSMLTVAEVPLDYVKQYTDASGCGLDNWLAWSDTWPTACNVTGNGSSLYVNPQPILSDIEFDNDGSMILGFMDRFGHQIGYNNADLVDPPEADHKVLSASGDILRLCKTANGFALENNGGCPANFGTEYYMDDLVHPESTLGALSFVQGHEAVITTITDPILINSGGIGHFDNETGDTIGRYELYFGDNAGGGFFPSGFFGKANGLGDLEPLCDPAPIEIGNYVWLDTDRDGIQDAGEQGLENIRVTIFNKNCDSLATVLTDNKGEYYFNDSIIKASTYTADTALLEDTVYYVVLGINQFNPADSTLNDSLQLTIVNAGADNIDSDASIGTADCYNGYPYIVAKTEIAGCANHTYDFGFSTGQVDCGVTITNVTHSNCVASNGTYVTNDTIFISVTDPPSGQFLTVNIGVETASLNITTSVDTFVVFQNQAIDCEIDTVIASYPVCTDTTTFIRTGECLPKAKVLFFCGLNKAQDADAWDHGMIQYLEGLPNVESVAPYEVTNSGITHTVTSAAFTDNYEDYDWIFISQSLKASNGWPASFPVNLKATSTPILVAKWKLTDDLGLGTTSVYVSQSDVFDGTSTFDLYDYPNPSPSHPRIVLSVDYNPVTATVKLWEDATDFTNQENGVWVQYNKGVNLADGSTANGIRIFYGIGHDGFHENAGNTGMSPVPSSEWFNPYEHLTFEAKSYLDQAIQALYKPCDSCKAVIENPASLDCATTSIVLDATNSSTGGTYSYSWSGAGIVSGNTTLTPTINQGGVYSLTVTNSVGCNAIAFVTVTNNSTLPTANAGANKELTCSTTSVVLDGSNSSTGANYSYQWSGNSIVSGANTLTPTVDQAGVYSLTVTNTLSNCLAMTSVTVTSNTTPPTANAGNDETICKGKPIVLTATGGGTYVWNTTDVTNSITVNPTITTTYSVTVTNSNGCTASDEVIVTVESCCLPPKCLPVTITKNQP